MQTKLREEINGDFSDSYVTVTDRETKLNQHPINCVECNTTFYADRDEYDRISRLIEQGLDNPFLCDNCREEYEELAHER